MEDHRSPLTIEQKPENTEQLVTYGQLYPELLILPPRLTRASDRVVRNEWAPYL